MQFFPCDKVGKNVRPIWGPRRERQLKRRRAERIAPSMLLGSLKKEVAYSHPQKKRAAPATALGQRTATARVAYSDLTGR